MALIYNPNIFNTTSIDEAKKIILTKQSNIDTDERWEKETKFLTEDISKFFSGFDENSIIIDFGCGIGRLSKELIKKFNCRVIGIDISDSMRIMAKEYVNHSKFDVISPEEFRKKILNNFQVNGIISIWVLQHSFDPISEIKLLKSALKSNGLLYILNNKVSAVPTNQGWKNNGIDIFNILKLNFDLLELSQLPDNVAKDDLKTKTFIAKLISNKDDIKSL
jgi:SAM-dependent methyltransferase